MSNEKEKLDNKWIIDFEKKDKFYQDFYTDDLYFINLQFIYIQKNMKIEKIREETFFMKTPNIISREEIIDLLKRNALDGNNKYTIYSLLKFNFSLKPEELHFFLRDYNFKGNHDFLTTIKHIDTIVFEKTINMFQDLNTLYFFL
jgi:nicotinic acid phosphoribosyltransferase